ncbi:hypothetical protein SCHPADRAFT_995589 [Schizopora paradoxa]|uniref:Uncharacterized protein n=1 Tax=Schizopora paradoxa TaxID=27342 RepID=A0A0H2RUW9_9AGAM|nr:hypothetical protein SCHPADRAFT_995589 [Schizopora paradoxa]
MAQAQDTFSHYYELDFQEVQKECDVRAFRSNVGNPMMAFHTITRGSVVGYTTMFYLKPGYSGSNAPINVADITWYPLDDIQAHGSVKVSGGNFQDFTAETLLPRLPDGTITLNIFGVTYFLRYEGGNEVGVYYYNGSRRVKVAIIRRPVQSKLRISLSDNNITVPAGTPDVMANLRDPARPLKLFLAAICLLTPGQPLAAVG